MFVYTVFDISCCRLSRSSGGTCESGDTPPAINLPLMPLSSWTINVALKRLHLVTDLLHPGPVYFSHFSRLFYLNLRTFPPYLFLSPPCFLCSLSEPRLLSLLPSLIASLHLCSLLPSFLPPLSFIFSRSPHPVFALSSPPSSSAAVSLLASFSAL